MTVPAARDVLSCAFFFFLFFFNKCSRLYVLQPSHCHHAPIGPENHPTQLLKCIHAAIHSMQGRLAAAFKAAYSWCMSLFDGAAPSIDHNVPIRSLHLMSASVMHPPLPSSFVVVPVLVVVLCSISCALCTFPCGYALMT